MSRAVRIKGVSASIGVAVGPATWVERGARSKAHRRIADGAVAREVHRFTQAVDASTQEIKRAKDTLTDQQGPSYASILDVHLLMHSDALLIDATTRMIEDEKISAEWALGQVVDELKAPLLSDSSAYFRERARDIEHVREHLLRHLSGDTRVEGPRARPAVLVAHDLTPADAVHLLAPPTLGLVTEMGGPSSHTAILARAFGVPAVTGTGPMPVVVEEDEIVIVDGFSGVVTIGASESEQARASERRERFLSFLREEHAEDASTRDGVSISVGANIELPSEVDAALERAADGVGLYRTEFMCLDRSEPPSESVQLEVYRRVASAVSPNRVVFRTFDWRDDKRLHTDLPEQHEQDWLRVQVRAILQAQDVGVVSLMFPMIGAVSEFERGRALVSECANELAVPEPQVGMMVEVPSAALGASRFAKLADFFAIGTNDLVQYTLGLDRRDYRTAISASPLHPAVLGLIEATVVAAREAEIPCSMCGNMAADPAGLTLALGLGVRDVSVPVSAIPLARAVVRSVSLQAARAVAEEAMTKGTVEEVRALVRERIGTDIESRWENVEPTS